MQDADDELDEIVADAMQKRREETWRDISVEYDTRQPPQLSRCPRSQREWCAWSRRPSSRPITLGMLLFGGRAGILCPANARIAGSGVEESAPCGDGRRTSS